MLQNPFMSTGNMLSVYRQVAQVDVIENDWQVPFNQAPGRYVLSVLITAAPVTTNVGVLTVHYTYDCIPAANSQQMAVLDYPKLGPFTADFLAMLYVNFTGLQALDYKTAARLAQAMKTSPSRHYDHLTQLLLTFLSSYVPPSAGTFIQ